MIPISLRNVPPPEETFNHTEFILQLAKWIKPENYLELGIRGGNTFLPVAALSKHAVGVDIEVTQVGLSKDNYVIYLEDSTEYLKANKLVFYDLVFMDASHDCNKVFTDFQLVFPQVILNGFILIHDTFPIHEYLKSPYLSGSVWKVPSMIQASYGNKVEVLTLPFNPGLTLIKKTI